MKIFNVVRFSLFDDMEVEDLVLRQWYCPHTVDCEEGKKQAALAEIAFGGHRIETAESLDSLINKIDRREQKLDPVECMFELCECCEALAVPAC